MIFNKKTRSFVFLLSCVLLVLSCASSVDAPQKKAAVIKGPWTKLHEAAKKGDLKAEPVVLEEHLLNTPVLALEQAKREIIRIVRKIGQYFLALSRFAAIDEQATRAWRNW